MYLIASTSKDTLTPLHTTESLEGSASGFPWDYDMSDELLKLLITKARLFEAQIRYAHYGPLVAIEVRGLRALLWSNAFIRSTSKAQVL